MGVQGLWSILDSTGHPIKLEALEGKILGVDATIWLYQFLKGFRDKNDASKLDGHKIGLFRRISKLLYYKIKPVFVFDGPAPLLKRRTLERRQESRSKSLAKARGTALRILTDQIKSQYPDADLEQLKITLPNLTSHNLVAVNKLGDEDLEMFRLKEQCLLGQLEEEGDTKNENYEDESEGWEPDWKSDYSDCEFIPGQPIKIDNSIERSGAQFNFTFGGAQDLSTLNIDSEEFKNLPAEVRHEILTDLKESRKRNKNIKSLPEEADNFSSFQLQRLRVKRAVQEKIEEAEKEICSSLTSIHEFDMDLLDKKRSIIESYRVHSDPTKRMLYLKNLSDQSSAVKQGITLESGKRSYEITNITEGSSSEVEPKKEKVDLSPIKGSLKEYFKSTQKPDYKSISKNLAKTADEFRPKKSLSPIISDDSDSKESQVSVTFEKLPKDKHDSTIILDDSDDETDKSYKIADKESLQPSEPDQTGILSQPCDNILQSSSSSQKLSADELEALERKINSQERYFKSMPNRVIQNEESLESCGAPYIRVLGGTAVELKRDQEKADLSAVENLMKEHTETTLEPDYESISTNSAKTIVEVSSKKGFPSTVSDDDSKESFVSVKADEFLKDHHQVLITLNDSNDETDVSDRTENQESTQQKEPKEPKEPDQPTTSSQPVGTSSQLSSTSFGQLSSDELEALKRKMNREERHSNSMTDKIIRESKELLELWGIPYIVAHGEAEAQCATLESLKLTDGTITDDSDVWLFGAQKVYKNFFSNHKYAMQYKLSDIEHHIRLNRESLICIAMLVGSDYTDGIEMVGPVTALEILSEFPGPMMEPLKKFKEWWLKYKNSKEKIPGNKRRARFVKFDLPEEFPSQLVFDGYMQPSADDSDERFTWGMPKLDELREYARQNFGWDSKKIDENLLPVMQKVNDKSSQPKIDSFFFRTEANKNPSLFRSKRVNQALESISGGAETSSQKSMANGSSKKKAGRGRKTTTKSTARRETKRGRERGSRGGKQVGVESRSVSDKRKSVLSEDESSSDEDIDNFCVIINNQ